MKILNKGKRKKKFLLRGNSMPIAMMFFMVIGTVTVVAVGVSQTNDSMVNRGVNKTQATALAESGVHHLYDKIARELYANQSAPTDFASTILSTQFDGKDWEQGTYSGRVIDLDVQTTSPAPGYSNSSTLYTYTFELEGQGIAQNGVDSVVRASFTGTRVIDGTLGSSESGSNWKIYPGVIQSQDDIRFVTNGQIRTMDNASQDKEAHVVSNGMLKWDVYTGIKSNHYNDNIIQIEGHALVASEPTDANVVQSRGIAGWGNPNGKKNYRTAPAHVNQPDPYNVVQNEITGMGQALRFLDWDGVMKWRTATVNMLNGDADTVTHQANSSGIVASTAINGEIQAPAFIDGNLLVEEGRTLKLKPKSEDETSKNIIYVRGHVANLGRIENLGVTLVSVNGYADVPNAEYKLDFAGSIFNDLNKVYKNACLMSLSPHKDSIIINSNASAKYGLVYAALGGIQINSQMTMNGILVAGGKNAKDTETLINEWEQKTSEDWEYSYSVPSYSGPKTFSGGTISKAGGGINITPLNGASFAIEYAREAMNFALPGGDTSNGATILQEFKADKLKNWGQLR